MRVGWRYFVQVQGRTGGMRACEWPSMANQKQSNLNGTKKNETDSSLTQHDQRHRSVSVGGRLRHNEQHPEQREHAGGVRL